MNLLKDKNKLTGGALMLGLFLAVCFMIWLFPVNAFAAESVDWSVIRNTVLGVYHENSADEASGSGWTYSNGTVTIAEGTIVEGDVAPFGGESSPAVNNIHSNGGIFTGTINGGNFTGTVINEGTINGGTFEGNVTNNGRIYGGTFTNAVTNDNYIHDGTFNGTVTNMKYIEGGVFKGAVKNNAQAHIGNGTFDGYVTNEGFIDSIDSGTTKGTFNGTVTNDFYIFYGTFNIIVNKVNGIVWQAPDVIYNQLINEGNGSNPNPNPGDDEGNTPPQNPGNNENNTSNSKDNTDNENEYVFVEPVIIVVPEGQKYVDDVMEQLATVPTDGKVVIDTKDWYCFNRTLAEKVTSMKDITVTIKYKYQGKKYEVTIPAGSDIVSLLGETGFVGFRYLDLVFGGREITE